MRILLSGCEGQLGRALAVVLPAHGELHAFAKTDFDLTDEPAMRTVLDSIRPDLIVNAAAFTAVDQAETDAELAMAVNGAGPGMIARWAEMHGAALLHYSTDYVFDGEGVEPYRETDAVCPVNRYGESKLAGERAIRDSGARHLIVRTSWLYDGGGRNFLTTILRLAAERDELRIVDDQIGAPTPVGWLAAATGQILSVASRGKMFGGKTGGILNAACAGSTTWYGFTCAIVSEAHNRGLAIKADRLIAVPSSAYPAAAKRPSNSVFALDRLRDGFGIAAPDWHLALLPVMERYAAALASRV